MKKGIVVAMTAISIASGFLSFGQKKEEKMADEPLLTCPEECCTAADDTKEKCCKDTEMCCE